MAQVAETGTVAGVEQVGERLYLLHLDLPQVAPHVQPGHCVLLQCADPAYPAFDPFLPRAYFVFALDRGAGRLSVLVERRGRGSSWLASRKEGDQIRAHGPIGRAVSPDRLTRHLLLLADSTTGVAALTLLGGEAARRGLSVTLVENAAGEGIPPHLLRADVEYRATTPAAGGLLGALPQLLSWADELVIAAAPPLLDTLSALRRARLAPFTLYAGKPVQAVPLADPASSTGGGDLLPCGTGACGACTVPTRGGTRLFCQHGPAFPLEELRLESEDDNAETDEP
jgi:hypothetical protein